MIFPDHHPRRRWRSSRAVPQEVRDASLALGATRWQTIKHVVLRKALPGHGRRRRPRHFPGLRRDHGRAHGRRQCAQASPAPSSIPAYPLPALIANNYGEMMSIPLYDSALHAGGPGPAARRPGLQRPGPADPGPGRTEHPLMGIGPPRRAKRRIFQGPDDRLHRC